jgi:hypothetical protein
LLEIIGRQQEEGNPPQAGQMHRNAAKVEIDPGPDQESGVEPFEFVLDILGVTLIFGFQIIVAMDNHSSVPSQLEIGSDFSPIERNDMQDYRQFQPLDRLVEFHIGWLIREITYLDNGFGTDGGKAMKSIKPV